MARNDALDLLRAEILANKVTATPHHVIRNANTRSMDNVHCVYAIPLLRDSGKQGVFFPGTNQWINYKRDDNTSVTMVAAQLFMLAVENADLGASYIDVDKRREPGLYRRVLEAVALKKLCLAKDKHCKLLDRYVKGHYEFSISMQRDILDALKNNRDPDDEEIDGPVPAPVPVAAGAAVPLLNRMGSTIIVDLPPGDLGAGRAIPGSLLEHMSRQQLSPSEDPIFAVIAQDVEAGEAEDEDEENLNNLHAGAAGNDRFSKVEMTLTPIGRHGYLLQFHVWDPTWNPTVELLRILTAASQRACMAVGRFPAKDPYEKYSLFSGTGFPTHGFTWDKYVRLCRTYMPTLMSETEFHAEAKRGASASFESRLHASKVFSLENALRKFREAGADASLCAAAHLYYEDNVSKWPEGVTAYHYESDTVKWFDKECVGLCFQYLPDCPPMQNIQAVLSMIEQRVIDPGEIESNEAFMAEVREAAALTERQKDLNASSAQRIMYINQVQAEMRAVLEFSTSNELVYCAFDAANIEHQIQAARPAILDETLVRVQRAMKEGIWPHGIDDGLREAVAICTRYQNMVQLSRKAQMDRLSSLCQLEGDMSVLPIPKAGKTILEWFRDKKVGETPFTRSFKLVDPEMSFLGNTIVKTQSLFDRFGKVIQPVIPMLVEGLFSVYEYMPRQLAFNVIIHGRKAGGKTHGLINTPASLTCIPGTLDMESHTTDKADLTDMHIEDTIRMQDEVEQFIVDTELAKKDAFINKVNRLKEAMTNGYLTTKCYTDLKTPGSNDSRRGFRLVVTMQNYVRACVTNAAVGDPEALSSRFHCRTMHAVPIPASSFNFQVSAELKAEAAMYFQKLQFCSYWAKKAAMIGALPQKGPDMSVWDDVTARMHEYIKKRGIHIDDGDWSRSMDKMRPYARQMIYNQAQVLTFDLPSSPHYGKPFRPEMLLDMGPHLYCTREIVLYVVTLLADEIIREDIGNVLGSMMNMLQLKWSPEFSPYEAAVRSKTHAFRYRLNRDRFEGTAEENDDEQERHPGPEKRRKTASEAIMKAKDPKEDHDKFSIDLNQMVLTGSSMPALMDQIAAGTNPKLGANDCSGVLKQLVRTHVHMSVGVTGRNGYHLLPRDTFRRLHAHDMVPRHKLLVEKWRSIVLSKYAMRHFRRATSKLTNVDEEMRKTPEQWEELHRELKLTDEQIIVLYLAAPHKTLTKQDALAWLEQTAPMIGDVFPITEEECHLISGATSYGEPLSPEQIAQHLSWVEIKTLCMAIRDDMFLHPDSTNRSPQYSEAKCHGWQGDYREEDVPDANHGKFNIDGTPKQSRNAVPVVEFNKDKIYFNPCAISMFDKQIIVDAWIYATMCDSFTPQKYILGWMHEDDLTKFDVLHITEQRRDELVRQLVAMGPHEAYRQSGLRMNRRGFINEGEKKILFSVPINGMPSEAFAKRALAESTARSQMFEIVDCIDDRAAYAQHLSSGRPLDEPIQTPDYRRSEYIRAWNANPLLNAEPALGDLNYPLELIVHGKEQLQVWDPADAPPVPSFSSAIRTDKRRAEHKALAIQKSKRARADKGKEEDVPAPIPLRKKNRLADLLNN